MSEIEIAWLAGILEGEGCFSFRGTPTITVVMTDHDIVERVAKLFNKHVHESDGAKAHHKRIFRASIYGDAAIAMMKIILPYMGVRRTAKINEIFDSRKIRSGYVRGENAPLAKMTNSEVIELRRMKLDGTLGRIKLVCNKYGISRRALEKILNYDTYREALPSID